MNDLSLTAPALTAADGAVEVTDHLELLAVMGRDFASTLDIDATILKALEHIIRHLHAEGGAVFLLEDEGRTLHCTSCVGATDITGLKLNSDQGIVGRSVQENRGEIVRDVAKDPNFNHTVDEKTGFTTRSILCAPMSVKDERIGAIELVNKSGGDGLFSQEDLQILEVLSVSAALAILNARMAEALVEQERVRRELELAAEIQRSLLPEAPLDGFPLYGVNVPARKVSGDFYDFFVLADGRICFNLGDVSGKGMNAALLMAKTASIFRCLGKTIPEPGRLMSRVNAEVCETATRGMFVTMVGGVLDPRTGRVVLANAGHEPPLVRAADGTFTAIAAEAPPLGIAPPLDPDDTYPETELWLNDETLYIFTDGVTEGYLSDGGTLESSGLQRLLNDYSGLPVRQRLDKVVAVLNRGDNALRDDLTVLAVEDGRIWAATAATDAGPAAEEVPDRNGEELLVLEVPARADRLKLVRNAVSETATLCGCDESVARDMVIAVDEACQNVIRHAYGSTGEGSLVLEIRRGDGEIVFFLRDFANTIDVEAVRPRDLDDIRPGGLGTHFMRAVMDEVAFQPPPQGGGNLLKMTKRIA
ncbi:MAG: SpoIIE family protein phosphatase [Hyphomicrobiales bacterium]|nr:SpoIIE family protein phosphatase [Hyphomicrobiales bacterium]